MTLSEYKALISEGTVLEEDGFGIKVVQLPGERILKLFRRKRLLSSQIWMTHAKRFSRNASQLQELGIATIDIISTFEIPEIQRSAVLYNMLSGITLRDWLRIHDQSEQEEKIGEFGQFMAHLHEKGVLFRSLHFANVLVTSGGRFGLIDISDMGFRRFGSLTPHQRLRNFHHMNRQDVDRQSMSGDAGRQFIRNYQISTNLPERQNQKLAESFAKIFDLSKS